MELFWFILVIILAIILFIFSTYLDKKKEKGTWSGILENKKIEHFLYREKSTKVYIINVRKDSGEKVTYSVNATIYNSVQKGARLVKGSGKYLPTASEN